MNKNICVFLILSLSFLLLQSCDKETTSPMPLNVERNIQFVLYTDKDFSDDDHNISFSIFVRDDNKTILDSAVATMKVKEIPGEANKITINRTIITAPSTELMAGFVYEIEHVGVSWYLDTIAANQNNKTVEFAFQ